jgi:hypothetical protein
METAHHRPPGRRHHPPRESAQSGRAMGRDELTPKSRRPIVELMGCLDANWLMRIGAIPNQWPQWNDVTGISFRVPDIVGLLCCVTQIKATLRSEDVETVRLAWRHTASGRQLLMHCPQCQRRMRLLYVNRARLKCRQCHGAVYISNCRNRFTRPAWQAIKIRAQLSGVPSNTAATPQKPRGMWNRRYQQLCHIIEQGRRQASHRQQPPQYRAVLYHIEH